MFLDSQMMRVMVTKYRRLAEQQTDVKARDKFRAYARVYAEMAHRFQERDESARSNATRSPEQIPREK